MIINIISNRKYQIDIIFLRHKLTFLFESAFDLICCYIKNTKIDQKHSKYELCHQHICASYTHPHSSNSGYTRNSSIECPLVFLFLFGKNL